MQTTYAQKNDTVQKASANTVQSVVDSSSQSATLQRHAALANAAVQRAENPPRPNNTGLPDDLKNGIESLSGYSLDDVRVHYNSSKPATVQALAYTQGTDIHVAPGQEKHLPHEAWHVAQQMADRVSPTTNINGMLVNDNAGLEHEADVMGEKAMGQSKNNRLGINYTVQKVPTRNTLQAKLIINSWEKEYTEKIKNILTNMVYPNSLTFKNNWITPFLKLLGLTSCTTVEKADDFKKNGKSAQLIARLIDSDKTTLITSTNDANRAMPIPQKKAGTNEDESMEDTLQNASYGREGYGEGRNANVFINATTLEGGVNHYKTQVPTENGYEQTPDRILLGHELIHADRINRGAAAMLTVPLPDAYYAKEKKTSLEDIFTIGLKGKEGDWHYDGEDIVNQDVDTITENDLRRECNLSLRTGYY